MRTLLDTSVGGKINVAENKEISLFDANNDAYKGNLVSPANTVIGAEGAKVINNSPASSTLNGVSLEASETYVWDITNEFWVKED